MALQISTGLATTIAGTSSLVDAVDYGVIKIYSGTVPTGADDAIGSATLLCEVKLDGTDPLEWAHNGGTSIGKPAGAVWSGSNIATGTASFFRITTGGDTGATSTSEVRVQGTVGLSNASNMVLQNVSFVNGVNFTLNNIVLNIPLAPR